MEPPSDHERFWERAEQVEEFASRDPDTRLVELLPQYAGQATPRVLDLGCAGGRNTELLLSHGFDVIAVDASRAMVERTRERARRFLGSEESERRIKIGRMDDLSFATDGEFDLIVALGIYQQAQSDAEWDRALEETARVLQSGGRCLVANFAPGTGSLENPPRRVVGTRYVYDGFHFGSACLLPAESLDAEFRRVGLYPESESKTVERTLDKRRRVTVNSMYRKEGPLGRESRLPEMEYRSTEVK